MHRRFVPLLVSVVVASAIIVGCSQAAPAPPPTTAPAPTAAKPSEPTKAPAAPAQPTVAAAQPTAAPAKKVDFPEKGRSISIIVPLAAGGSTDVSARMVSPVVEKDLGTSIQIVNKAGGGTQIGNTDVANAKPDGYTLGYPPFPTILTSYLDPDRQAAYKRNSFAPVARSTVNTVVLAVKADSPYKTMKDLIDAAKANPEQIKVAGSGLLSVNHLAALQVAKQAGVKFAVVNFDGSAPGITALLGGHVDAASALEPEVIAQVKAGEMRVLGVADKQESKLLPGAPTMESQGFPVYSYSSHTIVAPAGTPREIVDVLSGSIKKALDSPDLKSKLEASGLVPGYLDPDQFAKFWEEQEVLVKPLLEMAKTK